MLLCDSNRTNLSAALGGYIYAIGGFRAGGLGPTERYDPATDTWTRLVDLGLRFNYGAVSVLNGQIWACGGKDGRNGTCQILDTATNSWIAAPTMIEPRSVIVKSKSRPLHNSIWLLSFQSWLLYGHIERKALRNWR